MSLIFPASRPNIGVRVIPKIPATLTGAGGIGVSKVNGQWTIEPKWDDLALIAPGILLDPTTKEIWVHDPITDIYYRMTLGGLGQALFWGSSTSAVPIGAGLKTFETQSGKDWLPGMFVQAFVPTGFTNFMIGQVTEYSGTTLTMNVMAAGGSGTHSNWVIVQSTLPGGGAPGASGASAGLNYMFVAGLSGDPGSGHVAVNSPTLSGVTSIRIHDVDRNGVDVSAEIATWDDSTTLLDRAKIKIFSPNAPNKFIIATVNGPMVDSGAYVTIPVTSPVGAVLPDVDNCQIEVFRTGDAGGPGPAGPPGAGASVADTPPPLPFNGQQWFESDTGNMYIWYDDGTSGQWVHTNGSAGTGDSVEEAPIDGQTYGRKDGAWIAAAGGGGTFINTGVGAVSRTVESRLRERFSVKDYGAVGDGSTDDTIPIQNAINAASPSNGEVYFPRGRYVAVGLTITPAILDVPGGTMQGLVSLRGDGGRQSWIVRKTNTNGHLLTIGFLSATDAGARQSQTRISGLCFYGAGGTATIGNSINCPDGATPGFAPYLDDVFVDAGPEHGIYIGVNRSSGYFNRVTVKYCAKNQLYMRQSRDHCLVQCSMVASSATAVSGSAIVKFEAVENTKVYGSDFTGAILGPTVEIADALCSIGFDNCLISGAGTHGALLSGSTVNDGPVTFCNCVFTDNSKSIAGTYADIGLASRANVSVIGCRFKLTSGGTVPGYHVGFGGTFHTVEYWGNIHEPGSAGAISNDVTKLTQLADEATLAGKFDKAGGELGGSLIWGPSSNQYLNDSDGSIRTTHVYNLDNDAHKGTAGSWLAISDARIKNVVGDYSYGLAAIRQITPKVYTFKGNDTDLVVQGAAPYPSSNHYKSAAANTQFAGLIAQEVEAVLPGTVTLRSGVIDGQPVNDMRSLDITELTYALINAVKELAARLEALET